MLRKLISLLLSATALGVAADDFVRVEGGRFMLGDSVYTFRGTNLWYAPLLAANDRDRLASELDALQALGIDNLRVLVGAEGSLPNESHIQPTLLTAPGVYDEALLAGLDFFVGELERRGMKGVFYLTNSWEWSGGYGAYLEWSGHGPTPTSRAAGYNDYVAYASQFVLEPAAMQMYYDHVRSIVPRYAGSPGVMAWQIANEPRAFSRAGKPALAQWIAESAALIKSLDPNHLVSTGSEGSVGCELDIDLWAQIHADPNIDYATIHCWPKNWQWPDGEEARMTGEYVREHRALTPKPLVLEEFGFPRDGGSYNPESTTLARDEYYRFVFSLADEPGLLQGVNFWGWSGSARPEGEWWLPGAPYTVDPAHERQGLYSVFDTDSTVELIKRQ